jgi:hypothetical protein
VVVVAVGIFVASSVATTEGVEVFMVFRS